MFYRFKWCLGFLNRGAEPIEVFRLCLSPNGEATTCHCRSLMEFKQESGESGKAKEYDGLLNRFRLRVIHKSPSGIRRVDCAWNA